MPTEYTTDLASTSFAQCLHLRKWRQGTTPGGKTRLVCAFCRQTFVEGGRDNRLNRIRTLGPLYRSGAGVRKAAEASGYAAMTVRRYFRLFRTRAIALCGCGQDARHQGWCSVRFRRSAARQAFMLRWHAQQRAETGECGGVA